MKKIVLLIIGLAFLNACNNDFIDLDPPSNLNTSGFYKTDTDINQAVLAAYRGLRDHYNNTAIRLGEIRSDNTGYSWLAGNPANEKGIDELATPLLEDNSFLKDMWDNSYKTILRANIVIGRAEGAEFTNENLRTQYIAEAKFIRALTYFWLNRVFGGYDVNNNLLGVVKVETEISQIEAYELGRASLEEVYQLIIDDLKYAEQYLPSSYPTSDVGRVTNGGATGLLGKVYMTMAGYPLNKGNEYYTLAISQFEKLIRNSNYILEPSYKDLFDVTNKNTKESLFEVQYKKGAPGGATGSPWNNIFAPRFSEKEVVLVGDKGGQNSPTGTMSTAYETGDPRKYVSMRDGYISSSTGLWVPERYVCKYYDVATSGNDNGNNWIELRLADIYLLYSEALVRTNGSKSIALEYINRIRERARNTPGDPNIEPPSNLLADFTLNDFPTNESLLLAIEKERRIELAFENHRWFDLVRTGRAKDVMVESQRLNGYPEFTWDDKMLTYPIPMTVMQSNPGKITQNKGYTQM
jgi:hypothetical protein